MTFDMRSFNGFTKGGRDYTVSTEELLPDIIGKRKMAKGIDKIAELTKRNRETVRYVIARMKAKKKIHIARWGRSDTGPWFPMWKFGPGKDAPKPIPLTSAEKCKRYRGTEKCQNRLNQQRQKRTIAVNAYRAMKSIDPVLAAIMGRTVRNSHVE